MSVRPQIKSFVVQKVGSDIGKAQQRGAAFANIRPAGKPTEGQANRGSKPGSAPHRSQFSEWPLKAGRSARGQVAKWRVGQAAAPDICSGRVVTQHVAQAVAGRQSSKCLLGRPLNRPGPARPDQNAAPAALPVQCTTWAGPGQAPAEPNEEARIPWSGRASGTPPAKPYGLLGHLFAIQQQMSCE